MKKFEDIFLLSFCCFRSIHSSIDKERIKRLWYNRYLDNLYHCAALGILCSIFTILTVFSELFCTFSKEIQKKILEFQVLFIILGMVYFIWCQKFIKILGKYWILIGLVATLIIKIIFSPAPMMEWLKQMLRFTDMTLEEIAIAVGMNGGNYFSRMFKKIEGISPREYRKQW